MQVISLQTVGLTCKNQTLSYVFGKNKQSGHLNWLGKFIASVLNFLDPGHTDKAVSSEETKK